jgi:hypothetical protein
MGAIGRLTALAVAAAVAAGCAEAGPTGAGAPADAPSASPAVSPSSSPSTEGPSTAAPADPAPIEVAGTRRPTVSWPAVADAATYRVTVLQDDGPTWAWEGSATEVVLGGGEQDGDGRGFRLRSAAVVSVTAHGPDGAVLRFDQVRIPAQTD